MQILAIFFEKLLKSSLVKMVFMHKKNVKPIT